MAMYVTESTANLARPKWGKLLSLSENPSIPSIDLTTDEVTLGRGKSCHPLCKDWPEPKKYSSTHCKLKLERDDAGDMMPYLCDTSTNGTFINGTRVGKGQKRELKNKDCIILVVPALSHPNYSKDSTVAFIFYDYTREYNPSGGGALPASPVPAARAEKEAPSSSPLKSTGSPTSSPSASSSKAENPGVSRLKKSKRTSKYDLKKGGMKFVTGSSGSVVRKSSKAKLSSDSTPEEFLSQLKIKPNAPGTYDLLARAVSDNDSEWVVSFVELGGLRSLLHILKGKLTSRAQMYSNKNSVVTAILGVFKKVMNDEEGYDAMLKAPNALGIVSLALDSENMGAISVRIKAAELLAIAGAASKKGRKCLLGAFDYFKDMQNERLRFTKLCRSLSLEDDVEYKTAVMMLINSLVGTRECLAKVSPEERIAVRHEMLHHGVGDVLTSLELEGDASLNQQVQMFRENMQADTADATVANVDVSDPVAIAKALDEQLFGTPSMLRFREIMKQFLTISSAKDVNKVWTETEGIISETVSALCSESDAKAGRPTRKRPQKLDFGTMRSLSSQKRKDTPDATQDKMKEEMQSLLDKNRALEAALEEEKRSSAEKLDKALSETKKSFEKEILDLQAEVQKLKQEAKAPAGVPAASPSEQAAPESKSEPTPSAPAAAPAAPTPAPAAPPAPPAPMMAGGPPPPPMMGGGPGGPPPPPMGAPGGNAAAYRYRPKVQMKQLYWKKIPPMKIQDTVWEDVDFKEVELDPQELETLFGAKQKKAKKEKEAPKVEENPWQNLVDLKRANNIGIMLTHLKMSPGQVVQALLKLDPAILTPNITTQLLKAVPTEEEAGLLGQFTGDPKELGKVERFLLELMNVPRLSERLELFKFKLGFEEAVSDLIWNYQTLRDACKQVVQSEALVRVLEIILAMGNFMNFGPFKAPTVGFQMNFLTRIRDTRSSETNMTATHWMAQYIEERNDALFDVIDQLRRVNAACKLSSGQLGQEASEVKSNMSFLKRELAKGESENPDDKFNEVMLTFSIEAKSKLEELDRAREEFNAAHKELAVWINENPNSSVAEEMLAIFSDFMLDLEKARADNEREREQRAYEKAIAARKAETAARKAEMKAKRAAKKKSGFMDKAGMTLRRGKMPTMEEMMAEEEAAAAGGE